MSETTEEPVRHRVRRKRRSRRSRRGLWIVLPLLGGILVLAAIVGGLLLRDLVVVRDALIASQTSLRGVSEALGSAELERASEELRAADRELGVARSRSRGPLWRTAGRLPVIRQPVEVVRGVVDVATAATAVADVAVREGGQLLTDGLDVRVDAGVVDLRPLTEAAEVLAVLPAEALRESTVRLVTTDPGISPAVLLDARARTLGLADEALRLIDRGDALLSALPSFLGAEAPRRYFLGVQTSGELRATGGLIGFYAVLGVDDGAFTLGAVEVYEGLDDEAGDDPNARVITGPIGRLSGPREQAAEAPGWFTSRYGHTEATARFSNINVDPDLPTTARIAMDLYELRTGERLDGMILIDPIGLQAILEATGSTLDLPPSLAAQAGLPDTLLAEDFAQFVMVDIYERLGSGRGAERKALLAEVGTAAFAEVFSETWDGVAVAQAIVEAAAGRHLQVFSEDDAEQASFVAVGTAGAFAPPPTTGDRLAVIANNAVGGKQDVHLGHRIGVDVVLGAPRATDDGFVAARRSTVRTTLVNPLTPTAFDEYIVGNCLVDEARNQCFEGPPGWNRTWFSVWTSGDDLLQSVLGPDGPTAVVAGSAHDQRVFDRYEEVGPQSEGWFELVVEGPVRLAAGGGEPVFTWTFWRQAKAIPDVLDVTVTLPSGWAPAEVELVGVGEPSRLSGVDAQVPPASVSVEGQRVRVTGSVSRDTTLQIALRRGG